MDGILVVSFGVTYQQRREKTIDILVEQFREEFPELPVYLAFTSSRILKRIYEEEKINIDTLEEALKRMYMEGITKVFIQPTYIFNGIEYKKMLINIDNHKKLFPKGISIGNPLLEDYEDYHYLFSAFASEFFQSDDKMVIFLGHSSNDFANKVYNTCRDYVKESKYKWYIGAVQDHSYIETIEKQQEIKEVLIVPLLFSLEEHVLEEIAGENENSWKSILLAKGYKVECLLKGMGEYEKIRELYINHLKEIINRT